MKKLKFTLIALFAVSALVLSACSIPVNAGSLTGTTWSLVSYGAAAGQTPAAADVATSLVFGTDGQVSGNMGCNSFGGKYAVKDGEITFSEVVSTMMACTNESVMTQEQSALKILNGSVKYELNGSTLVIFDSTGENALTLSSVSGK